MKLRSLTTLALVIAAVSVPVSRAHGHDSYIRHPGGPGSAGPVLAPPTKGAPSGGFDWDDAGVGAGFASGIALVTTGMWLASRGHGRSDRTSTLASDFSNGDR